MDTTALIEELKTLQRELQSLGTDAHMARGYAHSNGERSKQHNFAGQAIAYDRASTLVIQILRKAQAL